MDEDGDLWEAEDDREEQLQHDQADADQLDERRPHDEH
jgi:hypothetical protein